MQDIYTDIFGGIIHSDSVVSLLFALFGLILVNKNMISCREYAHFFQNPTMTLKHFVMNFYYP